MPASALELAKPDTRSRLLRAAQRLFRKRGYHGTGLADILELADAPKGSLYHHFPGGKEEMAVHVIDAIASAIMQLFANNRARSAGAMVQQVGDELVQTAEKTEFEICALFTGFVAERRTSPKLGQAVAKAYRGILDALQQRLEAEGMPTKVAKDRARLVVVLFEGGSLLAQAQHDSAAFKLAVRQAASLCANPHEVE